MPLREVECVTCRGETLLAVTLQPPTNGNQHTAAFFDTANEFGSVPAANLATKAGSAHMCVLT